jgi:hypothetical protein
MSAAEISVVAYPNTRTATASGLVIELHLC